MSDLVRIDKAAGVAKIMLASPETGNALNVAMAEAIRAAVRDAADDHNVRCVLLTAEGRFFCVGGDVKSIAAAGDAVGALLERITTPLHAAIALLLRMDKPVVVAVNGPAAGAGLGLATAGDIVLASDTAHFSMAYAGIGFSPDGGATWLLPRLIGLRRTQELAFSNRRVTSLEAVGMGLVTRSVASGDLMQDAREVAETLAAGPVRAFAATRRLLQSSYADTPENHMAAEALSVRTQAAATEGREGVSAFLGKRPANFVEPEGESV